MNITSISKFVLFLIISTSSLGTVCVGGSVYTCQEMGEVVICWIFRHDILSFFVSILGRFGLKRVKISNWKPIPKYFSSCNAFTIHWVVFFSHNEKSRTNIFSHKHCRHFCPTRNKSVFLEADLIPLLPKDFAILEICCGKD